MYTEKYLATVADYLLSLFIITPLVVLYWWATWLLIDVYLFPESLVTSAWISLAVGLLGRLPFYVLQDVFINYAKPQHWALRIVLNRTYTYILSVCTVFHWRGVWMLWKYYHGITLSSALISMFGSIMALMFMRAFQNCKAPPIIVDIDLHPSYYECPTRFGFKVSFSQLS